jgi:hypothetical protein
MFLCKPSCCRPEASAEGSLGTCVPRDDIPGRRPERSEGCTACARQDKVGGAFLNSPKFILAELHVKCYNRLNG